MKRAGLLPGNLHIGKRSKPCVDAVDRLPKVQDLLHRVAGDCHRRKRFLCDFDLRLMARDGDHFTQGKRMAG